MVKVEISPRKSGKTYRLLEVIKKSSKEKYCYYYTYNLDMVKNFKYRLAEAELGDKICCDTINNIRTRGYGKDDIIIFDEFDFFDENYQEVIIRWLNNDAGYYYNLYFTTTPKFIRKTPEELENKNDLLMYLTNNYPYENVNNFYLNKDIYYTEKLGIFKQ